MRLTCGEPITIDKVRYGERWFPRLFKHTDGSMLLYVEYGHDAHFSPDFRMQSHDGGITWHTPADNVPRAAWCHSFPDGQLWEVDCYGFHDPATACTSVMYGAWSYPGRPDLPVEKALVRAHLPSIAPTPLKALQHMRSYPTHHWWPLMNQVHGKEQLTGDEVNLLVIYMQATIALSETRLLALAYGSGRNLKPGKCGVYALMSEDRGRNWREIALVASDENSSEGCTECDLIRLKDGRLYTVMRTGDHLVHAWSADDGQTWTRHERIQLIDDPDHRVGMTWPRLAMLADGTLVLVYGRPGKNVVFDPTGSGTGWRGRLDLHANELNAQARRGVPPDLRLRGPTASGVRYWDSGDYLSVVPVAPDEMLITYDVQSYVESWGAAPYSGVRMVRVTMER